MNQILLKILFIASISSVERKRNCNGRRRKKPNNKLEIESEWTWPKKQNDKRKKPKKRIRIREFFIFCSKGLGFAFFSLSFFEIFPYLLYRGWLIFYTKIIQENLLFLFPACLKIRYFSFIFFCFEDSFTHFVSFWQSLFFLFFSGLCVVFVSFHFLLTFVSFNQKKSECKNKNIEQEAKWSKNKTRIYGKKWQRIFFVSFFLVNSKKLVSERENISYLFGSGFLYGSSNSWRKKGCRISHTSDFHRKNDVIVESNNFLAWKMKAGRKS